MLHLLILKLLFTIFQLFQEKGDQIELIDTSIDYIVSQMSIRALEERPRQRSENKSPDLENYPRKGSNTQNRNSYIGLTLMEYFNLSHSRPGLQDIDEESNSSISAGTPCFGDLKDQISVPTEPLKKNRFGKVRTEAETELIPVFQGSGETPIPKMSTINIEGNVMLDKNIVKLPSIHDHRQTNNSRQGMTKEGKVVNLKKQLFRKPKNEQVVSTSLSKQVDLGRIHQMQKHQFGKKVIKARVTSTSFCHMGTLKERQRIKTQECVPDRNLKESFIVTKYGMIFGGKKGRDDNSQKILNKHQNTCKVIRNARN